MTDCIETADSLKHQIDCVMGRIPCELRLQNVRLVDVFSGEIIDGADIFIDKGKIIDAGRDCRASALETINLNGALVAPGLIDAHVHIESGMLTPIQFARLIAPYGTTTIVADPHEIANVAGIQGIRFMMQEAKEAEITVRFMLPSCVPATPFETSGATLAAGDLTDLMGKDEVLGLAELMNVPGVLSCDPDILKKVLLTRAHGKLIDGHSPLTAGAALSAYALSGVTSDHECSTEEEVSDRVSRGMTIFMREGYAGQNVSVLSRSITEKNSRHFCLCTDDASPDDVLAKGHINNVVRRAVACGVDAMEALRMATINTAEHFGLKNKGAVVPGRDADLIVLDNLVDFNVKSVWVAGKKIAEHGVMITPQAESKAPKDLTETVHIKALPKDSFEIMTSSGKARVIGLKPGDLVTEHLVLPVQTDGNCNFVPALNPGILKLAVIERHHAAGNIGLGLVKGMIEDDHALNGAIASTIAHDSHNIVVVGDNDADMFAAVKALQDQQGGVVLVRQGKVIDSLQLEVGGLMTKAPAPETAQRKSRLIKTAHEAFHIRENVHPVMALSFLPLAVIPYLRVTDRGLFDAVEFKYVKIDPEEKLNS